MEYKKLAADLISECKENCADCEYSGRVEFECNITHMASDAIDELLALAKETEERCDRLNEARERANEACAKWEARAEQAERAIAIMWYAYENKDPECPHEYEKEAVREAERILGKWEDVVPGMMKEK